MRKLILAALAASLAALAIVPALASADVQRYQMENATLTTTLTNFGFVHTYNIAINPCTDTFGGTGTSYQPTEGGSTNETINGTLNNDGTVSFTANYLQGGIFPGYQWGVNNAPVDGTTPTDMWDTFQEQGVHTVSTLSTPVNATTYQNHGQYVSSVGGGADAAHSCIGMPINSSN
jgi:hypothetical protein